VPAKAPRPSCFRKKLGVPHISTGDLFRANIGQQTLLGREAQKYMDRAIWCRATSPTAWSRPESTRADAANGFVLDGYPRTVDQANALEKILAEMDKKLDAVLSFDVPESTVIERLVERGRTSGRSDDNAEVIHNRMVVYRDETAPLLEHYRRAGHRGGRGRQHRRGPRSRAARAGPLMRMTSPRWRSAASSAWRAVSLVRSLRSLTVGH